MDKKNASKMGLPPGTQVYIGKEYTHTPKIELISYNKDHCESNENTKLEDIKNLPSEYVHWINLDGLHHVDMVAGICKEFKIHPLMTEDILNTYQRPKSVYDNEYIFFSLKMLKEVKNGLFESEQVSIFLGKNWVLSFQEEKEDIFDPIRGRLQNQTSPIRSRGADYLVFTLLDIIIDGYLDLMDQLEEKSKKLEHKLITTPHERYYEQIRQNKYQLIALKKMVHPLREAVNKLLRTENALINQFVHKYIQDLSDHVSNVADSIESLREINDSHREIHFTSINHRMNRVMEVLTLVSTIFIPLTFITGLYGMNFDYMPELKHPNGYFYVLGAMGLISIGMFMFFRRKRML
jgi:magnesium transporter